MKKSFRPPYEPRHATTAQSRFTEAGLTVSASAAELEDTWQAAARDESQGTVHDGASNFPCFRKAIVARMVSRWFEIDA